MTGISYQPFGLRRYAIAILLTLSCIASTTGQEPNSAVANDIEQQIELLGSEDYAVRLKARNSLFKIGVPAIKKLEAAAKLKHSLDHETQLQAASVLAELRKVQIAVGSEQFLAGAGDLTCWNDYKQHFGDQPEQRALYADLFSEFNQLIQAETKTSFESQGQAEIRKLLTAKQPLQTAMAIFVMVEKLSTTQPDDRPLLTTSQIELNLSSVQNAKKTINSSKHEKAILQQIKTLLSVLPSDKHLVGRKLSTLKQFQSPIFNQQLLELVAADHPPVIRAIAISTLVTTGDESTIQSLSQWFDDTTEIGNFLQPPAENNPTAAIEAEESAEAITLAKKQIFTTVQIRDLCLLASIAIGQQNPIEFGFHKKAKSGDQINVKFAGFAAQPQREAAFQKWRQAGN